MNEIPHVCPPFLPELLVKNSPPVISDSLSKSPSFSKRCLLLDIDGVIGDLVSASCKLINEHFGTNFTSQYATDYALSFLNLDERVWLSEAWYSTPVLGCLELYPGVKDALSLLSKSFDYIIVATDRESCVFEITRRWLNFSGIPYNRLFVQPDAKLAAVATLPDSCEILLIDDKPTQFLLNDKRITAKVPNRTFNQLPEYDSFRFYSWNELINSLLSEIKIELL
jgi:uncharacterized HAD superfamily protein